MKIKATKNVTYLEAKKLFETQSSELDFSKIVQSLSSKPETKKQVHSSRTAISLFTLLQRLSLHRSNQNLPQYLSHSQVLSLNQIQSLGQIHLVLILRLVRSLLHNLVHNLVHSQIHSLVLSLVLSLVHSLARKKRKSRDRTLAGDHIPAEVCPLINMEKDLMIRSKWPINSMV